MKFLSPLILLIAAIGLFVAFINPQYQEFEQNYSQYSDTEKILANAEQLVKLRKQYDDKLNAIPLATREKLRKMIPDSIDPVRLIIELNTIAARRGIQLKNVKVIPETVKASKTASIGPAASASKMFGTAAVSFSFTSNYPATLGLFKDIEKNVRLLDTTGFSIRTAKAGTEAYDVEVTLRTYWLKPS